MTRQKSFVLAEAILALTIAASAILFMSDLQRQQQLQISRLKKQILLKRENLVKDFFQDVP